MTYNYENIGRVNEGILTREGDHVGFVPEMDGFSMPQRLVVRVIRTGSFDGTKLHTVDIHADGALYRASIKDFRDKGVIYKPSRIAYYVLPKSEFLRVDLAELRNV